MIEMIKKLFKQVTETFTLAIQRLGHARIRNRERIIIRFNLVWMGFGFVPLTRYLRPCHISLNYCYHKARVGEDMESIEVREYWVYGCCTSFTIEPEISNGLLFNKKTGAISGIPLAVADKIKYTITGYGPRGADSESTEIIVMKPKEIN